MQLTRSASGERRAIGRPFRANAIEHALALAERSGE
jgi:hypothetical protein